jgi:hypothetical protein
MNTRSFTIHFKKSGVCSKVLVDRLRILYANTIMSMNNAKMNDANIVSEFCFYG